MFARRPSAGQKQREEGGWVLGVTARAHCCSSSPDWQSTRRARKSMLHVSAEMDAEQSFITFAMTVGVCVCVSEYASVCVCDSWHVCTSVCVCFSAVFLKLSGTFQVVLRLACYLNFNCSLIHCMLFCASFVLLFFFTHPTPTTAPRPHPI